MRTERDPHDAPARPVGRPDSNRDGATDFSAWLRTHLKARRMSQRQLAQRSGVDHSSISRLVRGGRTPSLATAAHLARALGVAEPSADTPEAAAMRTARQLLDPIGAVERALRGDEQLAEGDIGRLMRQYLALRREGASRVAPKSRSATRRDAVPLVAAVSRANRPERSATTATIQKRSRLA